MPKHYGDTLRVHRWTERRHFDMTDPAYQWPKHRRAWIDAGVAGDGHRIGDVLTIGSQRVCVLARRRMPHGYLVAPDSPGVGCTVLVRWLGRVVRRANLGVLHWLYANELLVTPEHCFAQWSEVRIPWRRG